ncbi:MAG: hypothetical protein HYU97_00040 [Deltaproteobacteria bacterium]|nr:hypothetical protein [Deltaproteobacteria bacterium]
MAGKGRVTGDGQATRALVRIERDADLENTGRRVELRRATRQARREAPAVDASAGYKGYVAFLKLATMGAAFLEANRGGEPTPTLSERSLPVRLLISNWIPQAAADRVSPAVLQKFEDLPAGTYMVDGIKIEVGAVAWPTVSSRGLEVGFGGFMFFMKGFTLDGYLTALRTLIKAELKDQPNGKPTVSTIPPPLHYGQTFIGLGGFPFKLTSTGIVPLISGPAAVAQKIVDGE